MPILLAVITFIISLLPFTLGPSSPFYTLDQEDVYITNALSYVVRKQIPFYDHPGTPYIRLIAASYTPLRLWAKFVVRQPFLEWALQNFTFVFYYSRLFALIIYCLGIFIFLSAVLKYTNSKTAVVLAWLLLFSYSGFLFMSLRPTPDNFLMFSTSVWLWLFFLLVSGTVFWKLLLLYLAAGVSLAGKFNSLTLLVSSLAVTWPVLSSRRFHFSGLLTRWGILAGVSVVGFIVSTWSIRIHYPSLFSWFFVVASRPDFSAQSSPGWFNAGIVLVSIHEMLRQEPYMIILFLLAPLVLVTSWRGLKTFERLAFLSLLIAVELFFAVYAKFPKPHYQMLHYILLSALIPVLLKKSRPAMLVFIAVLFPLLIYRVRMHVDSYHGLGRLYNVERYIASHPPRFKTLWYIGDTRDHAILWGRVWSGEFYGPALDKLFPHLGEMANLELYRDNSTNIYPLFSVCWDQAYLRSSEIDRFLEIHSDKKLSVTPVPESELYLVISDHCQELI